MDIDMNILRMLEKEKEIKFSVLVDAIEQALLTAYHKSPGAQPRARVALNQKTGHVSVLAAEVDEEGNLLTAYEANPAAIGRTATHTAKQTVSTPPRAPRDA